MKIGLYLKYLVNTLHTQGRKDFFSAGYKCLYPECCNHGLTPWQHYVLEGYRKGYDNGHHPDHGKFFREGYEIEYPEIKADELDAWRHYAEKGCSEGWDNGLHPDDRTFFAAGYLAMYPDVAKAKADPWRHYVLYGKKEGRDNGLHPDDRTFFAAGYLAMYPDVAKAKADPWRHYVLYGKKEGRDNGLHPDDRTFFAAGYLAMYPDVARAKIDPWHHYALTGKKEGRDNGLNPGISLFCAEKYLANNPDVKKAGINPWKHYLLCCKNKRINYLDDYAIRLLGHEQETVRSVYLTQHKSSLIKTGRQKHKVLLIGHDLTVNGAPLSLLAIARLLISDGYYVDIAVKDKHHIKEIYMYDGIGADVFLLPDSTAETFRNSDRVLKGYDFVIVNTVVMAAYADLCRQLNIPHIWFIREDILTIQTFWEKIDFCKERFFNDYENILCVSKYVTDCLYDKFGIRCGYINNFINDIFSKNDLNSQRKFEPSISHRTVKFAVVGHLSNIKAQQTAVATFMQLSAFPQLVNRWKLFLIGGVTDYPLESKLKSVTRNIQNIIWSGVVTENKWDLFKSIDFFIIPSVEEASSRVAIEAAMLGKPVIVTTHVGAKYLAESNAGFVFEPEDITGLRHIILRCLGMTDGTYDKMSRQVRSNYEKTSSLPVYHSCLTEKINEAVRRCTSEQSPIKKIESSCIPLRDCCSGGNIVSFDHLEYIKFADFGSLKNNHRREALIANASSRKSHPVIGVVVPVFNGADQLKVLLKSLFENTDLPHQFVFVNDCSDEETTAFLEETIGRRDDCLLISNETSLGFVKCVNIGANKVLDHCDNFVILNSFAEVPSGWLPHLMKPIFDDENIASVMPLSNICDLLSFPFFNKDEENDILLQNIGLEKINEAIRNAAIDAYIDLPVSYSLCMGISGKVWKKIGGLNEALFDEGFVWENEWSIRAELEGFRNVLAPNLYVANHVTVPLSGVADRKVRSFYQQIISVMYPGYRKRLKEFAREYPLAGSIACLYISLAKQQGYEPEIFTTPSVFSERLSGDDGIFICKDSGVTKAAIKLFGNVVFIANAMGMEI